MRRTKEEAEKTRGAILVAAEHLFLENGVAHTSLEQIARAAGVTRGAVYWHFQNKAHLFHEMLSQVRLPQEQMIDRLGGCNGQDPMLSLRDLCLEAIINLARDEQRQRIFNILLHRCEFTEELREAEERHYAFVDQFIQLCDALFARAPCRERLRPGITSLQASRAVHGLVIGLFSDWTRDPTLFDPLTDAEPMVDALFRGLVKDWD
ncbi:TetR family transcriptional regulator [Pseudomonas sp. BN411]|uniref:TetR family transcriptional regulator n=1 Tax=Pseudomonas sp. BN411 TaxID=2567887 RepID=UPI002455CF9A|nr:TetR family transcriptional regulator [Pseudomonas sp. BN411]MDH4560114.1 TetR family transcriptional regulator [Pseudomonas sp. BN411]